MALKLDTFKAMIAAAGKEIDANEKRYSALDAAAGGDGDHGTAVVAAFRAMAKAQGNDFKSYLASMSECLENEACGSTSSLYGAWLEGMGDAAPDGAAELDAAALAAVFQGGLDEIEAATKARIGDKTLMDTLIPATEALVAASGEGIPGMFAKAAAAAEKGSAATEKMRAKFGRARNLGDRSIGPRDAGSASMASIFAVFAKTVA